MARGGRPVGNPELLDCPCGPHWDDLGNHCFHYWFHCSQLLGSTWIFMSVLHKLYENHRFHSYSNAKWTSEFNEFTTIEKNKEKIHSLFFISISTVLSSGAPPMHMFFPLKCSKKSVEHAPGKTYEIQNTYLKPMK